MSRNTTTAFDDFFQMQSQFNALKNQKQSDDLLAQQLEGLELDNQFKKETLEIRRSNLEQEAELFKVKLANANFTNSKQGEVFEAQMRAQNAATQANEAQLSRTKFLHAQDELNAETIAEGLRLSNLATKESIAASKLQRENMTAAEARLVDEFDDSMSDTVKEEYFAQTTDIGRARVLQEALTRVEQNPEARPLTLNVVNNLFEDLKAGRGNANRPESKNAEELEIRIFNSGMEILKETNPALHRATLAKRAADKLQSRQQFSALGGSANALEGAEGVLGFNAGPSVDENTANTDQRFSDLTNEALNSLLDSPVTSSAGKNTSETSTPEVPKVKQTTESILRKSSPDFGVGKHESLFTRTQLKGLDAKTIKKEFADQGDQALPTFAQSFFLARGPAQKASLLKKTQSAATSKLNQARRQGRISKGDLEILKRFVETNGFNPKAKTVDVNVDGELLEVPVTKDPVRRVQLMRAIGMLFSSGNQQEMLNEFERLDILDTNQLVILDSIMQQLEGPVKGKVVDQGFVRRGAS